MKNETPIPVQKTSWDKAKESFNTALMSAGIVFVVLLLIWIPFKLMPAIFGHGSNFISTTLSSLFIDGSQTATDTPATENTPAKTNDTNNNSVSKPVQTQVVQRNYYGKSDLQITLIGTGVVDPISKQFVNTSYAGSADEVAIRFVVKNVGTNVSGAWKLRINTPSRTTPYYDSEYQTSIKPGDKIVFTTTFNSPISTGINTAYITADPLDMISEISEANNQLIVPININGLNYNYNYNYNYGYNTPITNNGTLYSWSNINVNCYANPQQTYVGQPVTWYAVTSGGSGYYTYSWSGSDLLNSNDASVSKTYYSQGVKTGTVTVTSNGQSVTKQCSVNVY